MSLPRASRRPGPRPSPGRLLLLGLGLLLLPTMVAFASADEEEGERDLQCLCAKTTSKIHPKRVTSLELIKAGAHCATAQMIATLKDGRKFCLAPQDPLYKTVIKKLLES